MTNNNKNICLLKRIANIAAVSSRTNEMICENFFTDCYSIRENDDVLISETVYLINSASAILKTAKRVVDGKTAPKSCELIETLATYTLQKCKELNSEYVMKKALNLCKSQSSTGSDAIDSACADYLYVSDCLSKIANEACMMIDGIKLSSQRKQYDGLKMEVGVSYSSFFSDKAI